MNLYGIIGNPLSHSHSEEYFNEKFRNEDIANTEYREFEIKDIEELPELISKNPYLKGLNVTSPYKESVLNYLDNLDHTAKFIGAVNTILIEHKSDSPHLTGFNTDVYGFEIALKPFLRKEHFRALIIGSGGSSKAVEFVFKKYGISYEIVTRRPIKNNHMIYWAVNKSVIQEHLILVNTTPLGMHPGIQDFPALPYQHLTPNHVLFDMIYNPSKTRFLEFGENAGATIINGQHMFEMQAEKSWTIWHGDYS